MEFVDYPGDKATKDCPKCGKKMIPRWADTVMASLPPIYSWFWWCGGCKNEEKGGCVSGETSEQIDWERWEKANK